MSTCFWPCNSNDPPPFVHTGPSGPVGYEQNVWKTMEYRLYKNGCLAENTITSKKFINLFYFDYKKIAIGENISKASAFWPEGMSADQPIANLLVIPFPTNPVCPLAIIFDTFQDLREFVIEYRKVMGIEHTELEFLHRSQYMDAESIAAEKAAEAEAAAAEKAEKAAAAAKRDHRRRRHAKASKSRASVVEPEGVSHAKVVTVQPGGSKARKDEGPARHK